MRRNDANGQPGLMIAYWTYALAAMLMLAAILAPIEIVRVLAVLGAGGWWLTAVGVHAEACHDRRVHD